MRRPLAGFVVASLLLAALTVGANEAGQERLAQADLALLDGDIPAACNQWLGLLSVPGPYRDIALFHLAQWAASCPVPDRLDALGEVAGQVLIPALQAFRASQLLSLMASRAGDQALATRQEPLRFPAFASGFLPIQAPSTWAFAATTWPQESGPGEGVGAGGVAWSRFCFEAREPVEVALRLSFPNPGRGQLDGQELLLVGPDAGARFPVERTLALRLFAGHHELRTLQAVGGAQADVTVELLPRTAVTTAPCVDHVPLGAFETMAPSATRVPDALAIRLSLAHGTLTDNTLQALAAGALDSPEGYLVYRAALQTGDLPAPRREDMLRELASSFLASYDSCLPRLDLADAALAAGEREAARQQLDGADDRCRNTFCKTSFWTWPGMLIPITVMSNCGPWSGVESWDCR